MVSSSVCVGGNPSSHPRKGGTYGLGQVGGLPKEASKIAAPEGAAKSDQTVRLAMSSLTPTPMVEATDTFLM